MKRLLSEQQVLKKLNIPSFRNLTKQKAIEFVSMIPEMDPEVAKRVLEQFPILADTILKMGRDYKDVLIKGITEESSNNRASLEALTAIVDVITKQLEKEDLTSDERMQLNENLMTLADMISKKDTENKKFIVKVVTIGGTVVLVISSVIVALLGGALKLFDNSSEDDENTDNEENNDQEEHL